MKICIKCKARIDTSSNYCPNCGLNLNGTMTQVITTGNKSINIGLGNNNSVNIDNFDDIRTVIKELESKLNNFSITNDDKQKVESEINTLDLCLASYKPQQKMIQQSLRTLRNILEGTTGSMIATGILNQLSNFIK